MQPGRVGDPGDGDTAGRPFLRLQTDHHHPLPAGQLHEPLLHGQEYPGHHVAGGNLLLESCTLTWFPPDLPPGGRSSGGGRDS